MRIVSRVERIGISAKLSDTKGLSLAQTGLVMEVRRLTLIIGAFLLGALSDGFDR